MLKVLTARLQQKHRTIAFPDEEPSLPDRFRGLPRVEHAKCAPGCRICAEACPTGAISPDSGVNIDLGRCLFCTRCSAACPEQALTMTGHYQLSARRREDLLYDGKTWKAGAALEEKIRKLFGRSLKLRQVSAAGCNGCEVDINVLSTVVFDLARFGIQFVASPRHADGLLITGCVSENMRVGLLKSYEAVPDPKLVVAAGACAISGGPFAGNPEIHNGADAIIPVDLYVPGCPPHPITLLDGLLRMLGRLG